MNFRHKFDIRQMADGWHCDFVDHAGHLLARSPGPYSGKHMAMEWAKSIARKMEDATIVVHEVAVPSDD